ncbi:MAG TPA: hypothetical protein VFW03_28250 [Gemmatimonadaceae bacterium]|nr:hypothetical protein [Gemmatimonadaceae bacterium]
MRFARPAARFDARWKGFLLVGAVLAGPGMLACSAENPVTRRAERAPYVGTDTMGALPASTRLIRVQARPQLVESSAAAQSFEQRGVLFTINDSGNDPLLFALDTSGADRGIWRVHGATNVDWEAASVGPCRGSGAIIPAVAMPNECVYIGDTGDNRERHASRVIYRVPEPAAQGAGFLGDVTAEALRFRYPDGPHDVEAMYVPPNGVIYLITKRPRRDAAGKLRPALVFELPPDSWEQPQPVVARLVDSLAIVPGSAPLRVITDAALSPDASVLAVRTYAQVYTFATDPATGRVLGAIPPAVCNIVALDVWPGEGITWMAPSGKLLLTSEGRFSPMQVVDCPKPRKDP